MYHTAALPNPLAMVLLTFTRLWGDTQFADATIVMGDQTWKVHRWVLCLQSGYFMKALEGHFIVRTPWSHFSSIFQLLEIGGRHC